MLPQLVYRILRTTDLRALWKFSWNFGVRGMLSVERFKRGLKKGEYFPPFLYVSIINSCNLRCQGCWVDVAAPRNSIDLESMDRLITDAKNHGNTFFGILGGEPFMHPELLDILESHPDCYFQVFTNGQFITEKVAARLRKIGNVTVLISIEGREMVSDERRGKKDVLNKTLRGLDNALKHKILTGVATSVCQSNIDDLLTESWLNELIKRGVHYVWFHTYRPVGPEMNPQLGLSQKQLVDVRRFIVDMRVKMPIGIIDAYYDDKGQALCPMSNGVSHHVSPKGDIEPCPIIQFSNDSIHDSRGIYETIRDSEFLADFRKISAEATRGCVVLERPDLVKGLVEKHGAKDTTVRGTAMKELEAMEPRFSQWLPGEEIPEKHWMYRLAKRFWFNDFQAYRGLDASGPRHMKPGGGPESKLDGPKDTSHNTGRKQVVTES
jgi:MoaA/NifB/PqqE/SkfB family radical SAM enzyme